MVAHTYNLLHLRGRGKQTFEVKASLVYKDSSRTARATERPCLKEKKRY